ncbi:hypothetical protein Cgig2_018831 [Carnegiea gigantea]|uniref:Aminotransferase-like plant mobile domain-containing protein n=1 Tax=Carnegiea gigantea TaxID=171969 RepID=A0A9Q1QI37_9CARY|nr:hypothetical protein Cgig2_018831 [Carnegiea gigantea]
MDGTLGSEKAPLENGQECGYGPYYWRSSSLRSLNAIPSSSLTSILVTKARVKQGTLRYRRNDENRCVDVGKDYKNYFNTAVLEKVNTERRGPEMYPTEGEFYPALHRLLTARRNWGSTFQFRGRPTFMLGVMEWTKRVLTRYEEPLKQAGVFGAIGVPQFPYHSDANKRMEDLNITAGGELAAFLAFWLRHFVLPHDKEVVRPETFVMPSLMASGQRVSLAPTVLGYIYHGLGDAASNPDYPSKANTIFPIYYVINRLVSRVIPLFILSSPR